MRVAITGGTGFIGRHVVRNLLEQEHEVTVLARGERDLPEWMDRTEDVAIVHGSISERAVVETVVSPADAVIHLAGINYERGTQTYQAVHQTGTEQVVNAVTDANSDRLLLMSYLRARPGTSSGYLESKWRAEELVRSASVPSTILKPPAVFGPGDQLLTSLAKLLLTVPVYPRVGLRSRLIRPISVADLTRIIVLEIESGDSTDRTFAPLGPEELTDDALARRVAQACDKRIFTVPCPISLQRLFAVFGSRVLDPPLVTPAGIRMLAEGMQDPAPAHVCDPLPNRYDPTIAPSISRIKESIGTVSRISLGEIDLF